MLSLDPGLLPCKSEICPAVPPHSEEDEFSPVTAMSSSLACTDGGFHDSGLLSLSGTFDNKPSAN